MLLGVDTGGTFTDFFLVEGNRLKVHKVLSTPEAPEQAILQGIEDLNLVAPIKAGQLTLMHGSTVATNAALERKGVRTLYVTNRGLADVLTIGRQTRRELYNLTPLAEPAPVPADHCVEVDARRDAQGNIVSPLNDDDLARLSETIGRIKPQSVAINLLYSYLNDSEEKALEDACPKDLFVSRSSFVLPEYGEYERGMATWLNAYLGPKVHGYLTRLEAAITPCPLGIMQSSGGTIDARQASLRAVNLLLSGPAGGLAAAHHIAKTRAALNNTAPEPLLTFDMGGTSTDVSLILDDLQLTSSGHIGPYPVAVPMVDMHTIGAGGGSIAQVDAGGLLQVGPVSAGAIPGPACYGQGGTQATVTDANVLLGRLQPQHFLGGGMKLDVAKAQQAIQPLAEMLSLSPQETALGVIRVANEHMAAALRVISVQRGHNPAEFRLCCFGGAGGLHVCALAEELAMHKAIVPIHGGVLSAMGMLAAPKERQLSRSIQIDCRSLNEQQLQSQFETLAVQGRQQLQAEGVDPAGIKSEYSLDLRYQGQSFTLNLPWQPQQNIQQKFHQAHAKRYGHQLPIAVEIVNLRVSVRAAGAELVLPPVPLKNGAALETITLPELGPTDVYQRQHLGQNQTIVGPALIVEQVSTTLIAPNWRTEVDSFGNLLLNKISKDTSEK